MEHQWISSEGGPLVLIPRDKLSLWSGCFGNNCDETDYDRACKTDGYAGVLRLFDGTQALVLGDAPMQTAYLQNSALGKLLMRWNFAPNPAHVAQVLQNLKDVQFDDGLYIYFAGTCVLFDSAEAGSTPLGDRLVVELTPGDYCVRTANCSPDPKTNLILHQLLQILPQN